MGVSGMVTTKWFRQTGFRTGWNKGLSTRQRTGGVSAGVTYTSEVTKYTKVGDVLTGGETVCE
jgi:hypothetical protein